MGKYIKKTAIDAIQNSMAFELKRSTKQVNFHTEKEDYDTVSAYMERRAAQVQMVKRVAQALHNIDRGFSKEKFLKETFDLAKIK